MSDKTPAQQKSLEIVLILICMALCCLLHRMGEERMVVLNLFFLPVVLGAFFLGRYRAGVLALFCTVSVSVVIALDLDAVAGETPPLIIALVLTVWGAVLGINAILVGTLSDESTQRIAELHDAYLGVVEVLGQYLNSADPKLNTRAAKVSKLSRQVAVRMRLSDSEIDNIRVAALLQDIESLEVTARVIRKAMGDLARGERKHGMEHTFNGSDLVQSLGSVLTGALPLLVGPADCLHTDESDDDIHASAEPSLGVAILYTVRRYLKLLSQGVPTATPRQAIQALMNDLEGEHHPAVLHALEQTVLRGPKIAIDDEEEELVAIEKLIRSHVGAQ
jgi:hypothetical protein